MKQPCWIYNLFFHLNSSTRTILKDHLSTSTGGSEHKSCGSVAILTACMEYFNASVEQSRGKTLYYVCILEFKFDFSDGIGPYGVCQYIYEKPIPEDFSWQMQLLKMRKLTPGSDADSCLCKFEFPSKDLFQETAHWRFTNIFHLY